MAALTALVEKRSVIVSAPTGSGKTVRGEVQLDLPSGGPSAWVAVFVAQTRSFRCLVSVGGNF